MAIPILLVVALVPRSASPADQAEEARRRLPRDDNQIWTEYQYSFPLARNVDGVLTATLRAGRGMRHFVNERAGGTVVLRAGRHWTFAPGYSYVAFQPLPGKDTRENRLFFEVGFQAAIGNFLIADRSRIERRMMPPRDYFRYRNRLQLEHPVELGRLRLRAWVYDEVFRDGLLAAWSRNRIGIGVTRQMAKHLSMDFSYVRQNDHYSRPGDIHAVAVAFKFRT